MSRILITGSADGLGLMTGQLLSKQGHRVTLHARSASRADETRRKLPGAERVLVGDVGTLAGIHEVAAQASEGAGFDAVIHNVAIGYQEPRRVETVDGLELLFTINVLAPYLLTALVTRPQRLVYLSSGLHRQGRADLTDPQWKTRRWSGLQAYSDSKLFNVVLAFAVARLWPAVRSNALEPGWVPTKMGGRGAPDDLALGNVTQAWLATSDDAAATGTGGYFFHQAPRDAAPVARDAQVQDAFLAYCASVTGVALSG